VFFWISEGGIIGRLMWKRCERMNISKEILYQKL